MTQQQDDAPPPKVSLSTLMASQTFQTLDEERRELVRLAVPLDKERLCSVPYYRDRMDNEAFWKAYVGSRVTAARLLVERSLAASARAGHGSGKDPL